MRDRETTTRSRELGDELRRLRQDAGYNASGLARELGWSPSRISRLESGKRGVSEVDVAAFLACCRVVGARRDRLLDLARAAYERSWLQSHGAELPCEPRTVVLHEATASAIRGYEPLTIPGLLQTEDYARALLRWGGLIPEDVVEARVSARMDRQGLLRRREPPAVTFFLHEYALHALAGDPRVMNEQLLHLALVCGRAHCSIRMVPASSGPRGGPGGPFRLLEYAAHGPVAYVAHQTTSLFLEDREHIDAYRGILDRLAEIALGGDETRDLLVRLANDYDQPVSRAAGPTGRSGPARVGRTGP